MLLGVGWREVEGNIRGTCDGCGYEYPAIGLVPVPERMLFGHELPAGWFCHECRPREFGKVRGQQALAIPMGAVGDIVRAELVGKGKPRTLRPLTDLRMSSTVRHKVRKVKDMLPLK